MMIIPLIAAIQKLWDGRKIAEVFLHRAEAVWLLRFSAALAAVANIAVEFVWTTRRSSPRLELMA